MENPIKRQTLSPAELAQQENFRAITAARAADIEAALVELGELFAEQDDALVELASLLEED